MIKSIKYFLYFFLFFLFFVLFSAWKNEKRLIDDLDLNYVESNLNNLKSNDIISSQNFKDYNESEEFISVSTTLIDVKINPLTGDFFNLILKKYSNDLNGEDGVVLFNKTDERFYYGQSGIISNQFYDKVLFDKSFLSKFSYDVKDDESNVFVILKYEVGENIFLYKVYTFRTYSYEISIDFYIQNNGVSDILFKHYGLIRYKKNNSNTGLLDSGIRSYEGGAVYTNDKPYKKISFDDINEKNFSYSGVGGWIAFLERYFISVWIPDKSNEYVYIAEKVLDKIYSFKYLNFDDLKVRSNECLHITTTLFVGPKHNSFLNNLSKGLELSIDYGIFWPIASPIFFLLSYIFSFVGNWGFSIVLVTLIIKLMFFNLASISYRSIGNMKKLQPRLELLKEQHKNDKAQYGNAVMNLYKKENVNPLSGCLPVLIQIPVFISLYYVLLESIELRHAPFIFWISDLSSKDSYYILPIFMSLTMFIQQKMNPPIQDPLQAKVMMFLPLVFLFLFLQFPSGLILYWIVNNVLSILQQYIIVKNS
jgi:YidC/Oxa1 family membrane protein insertase